MNNPIMCHVVAGYPSAEECLKLIQGMHKEDVNAIEIQIPFSDPIADGETIMEANDEALANGTTTASSFTLIDRARKSGVDSDIYIMSYLQKVRHFGLDEFCQRAAECPVKGLIVPDLPYGSPEYSSLLKLTAKHRLELVPVLSPGMIPERLKKILKENPETLYITSAQGITGNQYAPAEQLRQLAVDIKKQSNAKIMIGFGISTPADVAEVLTIGDIAVVGSAVIKKIKNSGTDAALSYVRSLVGNS